MNEKHAWMRPCTLQIVSCCGRHQGNQRSRIAELVLEGGLMSRRHAIEATRITAR